MMRGFLLACVAAGLTRAHEPAAHQHAGIHAADGSKRPNIVFFLTDDQDQMLGGSFPPTSEAGATPMPKTQKLLSKGGATFTNSFVHTPVCNPSRSETLTGRMLHNLKQTGNWGGSKWSMHVNEDLVHNHTFLRALQGGAGYTTGLFGKYLNVMPDQWAGDLKPTDGGEGEGKGERTGADRAYAPPGIDAWMANPGGTYVQPQFEVQGMEWYGIPEGTWTTDRRNYTTAVVGNASVAWIRKVVAEDPTRPFFAYIAPKAAHEPFMPAPWYVDAWDPTWPESEPRDGVDAWNSTAAERADHPSDIAVQPMLTERAAQIVSDVFKNRWRTLMSVDDLIADVVGVCEELGVMDNTYFFYSSDHGFQLGQFNIIMDKRRVYEWDTRVHLLARGPGISPGSIIPFPTMNIDLAPTFLELAGIDPEDAPHMNVVDGRSVAPLLVDDVNSSPRITRQALGGPDAARRAATCAASWRDTVFFEYYFVNTNDKCTTKDSCVSPAERLYPYADADCGNLSLVPPSSECWVGSESKLPLCETLCYPTESMQNNFIAIRNISSGILYAEYQSGRQTDEMIEFDAVDFKELYNVTTDTWHMENLAVLDSTDQALLATLHEKLHAAFECAGGSCA